MNYLLFVWILSNGTDALLFDVHPVEHHTPGLARIMPPLEVGG